METGKEELRKHLVEQMITQHEQWLAGDPAGVRGDFSGCQLDHMDFAGRDLRKARFVCAGLVQANFEGCDLEGVDFYCANLTEAALSHANLTNANFKSADLSGAALSQCKAQGAIFVFAILKDADFTGTDLSDSRVFGSMTAEKAPVRGNEKLVKMLLDKSKGITMFKNIAEDTDGDKWIKGDRKSE